MDILERHLQVLGHHVRDKVTGLEGVAETVSFDLYGCVQVIIRPVAKESKVEEGRWMDIQRLVVTSEERVMPIPAFAALATPEGVHEKGPADKSALGRR